MRRRNRPIIQFVRFEDGATQPSDISQLTFMQACDRMLRIQDALDKQDWLAAYRLVGITDEIADQCANITELNEIALVRLGTIAQRAGFRIEQRDSE